jgi:Heavy metal binding domain
MKKMKLFKFGVVAISIILWGISAQSQTAGQLLKDNNKKQEIFNTIISDSTLLTEFTNVLIKNPGSCKIMMQNKGMMEMMMSDTSMMKMKKEMKSMNMPADSIYYTCMMHPEIISAKPGKCPKCGMDLVKKTVKKTMDKGGMKME